MNGGGVYSPAEQVEGGEGLAWAAPASQRKCITLSEKRNGIEKTLNSLSACVAGGFLSDVTFALAKGGGRLRGLVPRAVSPQGPDTGTAGAQGGLPTATRGQQGSHQEWMQKLSSSSCPAWLWVPSGHRFSGTHPDPCVWRGWEAPVPGKLGGQAVIESRDLETGRGRWLFPA